MDIKQQKLWEIEQDLLDELHRICTENGLRYSIAYGTLLGAVRHKGFIPWDDDIDVIMPREDYDRLISLWQSEAREGYILQEPYAEPDMVINFAKIRKDRTAFVQTEWEKKKHYHKGIFIDVFPFDRVAPGKISRAYQKFMCMLTMLYNRGYTSKHSGIMDLCERFLLWIVPKKHYRKMEAWTEKEAKKWNGNRDLPWFGFQTFQDMRHHYRADVFDSLITLPFEGKEYFAFRTYDQVLREEFGNYMEFPPVEQRVWKHKLVALSFDQNYEEIAADQ